MGMGFPHWCSDAARQGARFHHIKVGFTNLLALLSSLQTRNDGLHMYSGLRLCLSREIRIETQYSIVHFRR